MTLPQSFNACDAEPIHLPGAIQPHGYLLCLQEPDLRLVQASTNAQALFGRPLDAVLGQPVPALLGEAGAELIRRGLRASDLETKPLYLGLLPLADGRAYDAVVHRHDGLAMLELEPAAPHGGRNFHEMYALVRTFVSRLQNVDAVTELCELAAREMHRITGFGRVLVYRFDAAGHGHVLAEQVDPGYDSYLDQYFPASDIPQQARALYRLNHLRLIADAHYRPSPLTPALNPLTGRPTDLSYAALRSVSPVHVQYMKNMGTLASMSISILVRGELWGLISCHHAEPRQVPVEVRTACEHLGQILSLQIEAKEERAETVHRLELRRILVDLLSAMADREHFVDGLAHTPDLLLRFGGATGAAIVLGDRCVRVGDAPPAESVLALVDWLSQRQGEPVYATHHLAEAFEPAEALARQAAGVLAVSISQLHRNYVLWFRPEVVRTIKWAGQPQKSVQELHPRNSFEVWSEILRGQSLPWRSSELDSALEFRNAVLAIVMRRAEEMAQLAGELERSNKELEAFSYSVSHDLRAPLRHIIGYAELLREFEGSQLTERGNRFLLNIEESAKFAGTLVDDLLSFSQMGRSALRPGTVDTQELVQAVIRDLSRETANRDIEWKIGTLPKLHADGTFLRLALRNLLSNAVKYTRTRQPAVIEVFAEEADGQQVIHVRDNGVGFNMKYAPKLFGVFQRLHRMEDFEGTGIGLANVRRIVERHDGRVWADSELDRGATFSFSLPKP